MTACTETPFWTNDLVEGLFHRLPILVRQLLADLDEFFHIWCIFRNLQQLTCPTARCIGHYLRIVVIGVDQKTGLGVDARAVGWARDLKPGIIQPIEAQGVFVNLARVIMAGHAADELSVHVQQSTDHPLFGMWEVAMAVKTHWFFPHIDQIRFRLIVKVAHLLRKTLFA